MFDKYKTHEPDKAYFITLTTHTKVIYSKAFFYEN